MNIQEIGQLMELLEANYGASLYKETPKEKVLKLWQVMFQDDNPLEVGAAVKDCIATLTFPPKIADIKSRISQLRMAGQATPMEAWTQVYRAVMDCEGRASARKQFEKLPPIAQELIGEPDQLLDWKEVDGKQLTTVVASNFMKSYQIKAEREASYHALPADMQKVEEWKLPKGKEEPKELPKPEFKYKDGKRVLNIGFEPEPYMVSSVNRWMEEGVPDSEIRRRCLNWG